MKSALYKMRVVEAIEYGKRNGVMVVLAGPSLPVGTVRARFRRWGYQKSFLHAQGWDVGENWIHLQASQNVAGELEMVLPAQLAGHMEENSNYLVTLKPEGHVAIEQPLRWSLARAPRTPSSAVHPSANAVLTASTPQANDFIAWRIAQELDSRDAYTSFFSAHPASVHAGAAYKALERLANVVHPTADIEEQAWHRAIHVATRAVWSAFLTDYPEGRYAQQAQVQLARFLPERLNVHTRWPASGVAAFSVVNTCAFLLTTNGQVRNDADFVSSFATDQATGQVLQDSRHAPVRHMGAILDRASNRWNESLTVELDQVSPDIDSIALTVSIDTSAAKHLVLHSVNATIDLMDSNSSNVIASVSVGTGELKSRGCIAFTLRRLGPDWLPRQSTETFEDGIFGLCQRFGIVTS